MRLLFLIRQDQKDNAGRAFSQPATTLSRCNRRRL
jgi:hypothetical protein